MLLSILGSVLYCFFFQVFFQPGVRSPDDVSELPNVSMQRIGFKRPRDGYGH
jgi:hypothetical protein